MSFLDDTIKLVRDWDAARPRSTQTEVGWSEVGGCRAHMGYRLDGTWASDETDNWAATRGTAIHGLLEEILGSRPGIRTEITTSYRGIPGHADLIVDEDSVTDHKGLALTTPIPTPDGWTTMAAVQVGDQVFGSDGQPCRVTVKSAIKRIGTYIVRFKDGASVVCDREHLWWAMRGQSVRGRMEVVGIEEMAASVMKHGQVNWRVPVAEPLALPNAQLPVPPYVLGCWLGDGSRGSGRITGEPPIFAEIEREGFFVGPPPPSQASKAAPFRTVHGLHALLRGAGILNDRHLPVAYLRASLAQRQALIQGLMDTDGSWNKPRARAVFATTSKVLAEAMFELVASVGEKPVMAWMPARGFGVLTEVCHIEWSPTRFNPFRLDCKATQVRSSEFKLARARWRTVASIEPGPDVETACIGVDSPNRTYLCGHEMVPTHNTTSLVNARRWAEDHSLLKQKRIQVHGYAAGLVNDGVLPRDCTVRLLIIPVDGTFADWWAFEEKYDQSLADEGVARLEDVRGRMAAGETLPKDMPYQWCSTYCEFFSLCRAQDDPQAEEQITDPELVSAIAAYGEAVKAETAAKKVKEGLAPQLRGLRGNAGGWHIGMSKQGAAKEVPDEDAMTAVFEAQGLPVPMTTKPGRASSLSVRKLKGAA